MTRLYRKTAILIGAGTAICGTSAIVAVAPLIQAEDQDMLLAIGTVNILGLVFMFAMPLLGSLLNLSDQAFGVWARTSIHAVPQVLAAAFSYSQPAGAIATLVKLVRVALLAPLIFVLGIWHSRQAGAGQAQIHYHRSGSMGRRGFKATHKAKSGLVAVRGSTPLHKGFKLLPAGRSKEIDSVDIFELSFQLLPILRIGGRRMFWGVSFHPSALRLSRGTLAI